MKDSSEYAANLKKLCNRLRYRGGGATELESTNVTTAVIMGCLSEYTTETKAKAAINRIKSNFVDYNEVRVARPDEVAEVLGKNFPQGKDVAAKLIAILKEIFNNTDSIDLENLHEQGKREARTFLESLENANQYIVARTMLQALDSHAFPVNEQMLIMLRGEEAVDPKAEPTTVQGFLERHMSASQIRKHYALLRKQADIYKPKSKQTNKKTSTKKTKKKTKK